MTSLHASVQQLLIGGHVFPERLMGYITASGCIGAHFHSAKLDMLIALHRVYAQVQGVTKGIVFKYLVVEAFE